jgi:dTDP-4-dehydrorhamnose 3,5-epimerase
VIEIETTALEGVLVLTPRRFGDDRGWFSEVWNRRALADAGIDADFVQDNHSMSRSRGTLRGLHYQAPPHAQAKLVRCGAGRIWDVAVDVRRGSPTYGHWIGVELSVENGRQIYVPEGFLHGFSTLTDGAEVLYKCTDYYAPAADGSVAWNSPSLGIDWRLDDVPELSAKDASAPDFADWQSPFVWEGTR